MTRREAVTFTLDRASIARLDLLARVSGQSRGRVLDALLTHSLPTCQCPVCLAIQNEVMRS